MKTLKTMKTIKTFRFFESSSIFHSDTHKSPDTLTGDSDLESIDDPNMLFSNMYNRIQITT